MESRFNAMLAADEGVKASAIASVQSDIQRKFQRLNYLSGKGSGPAK
jgi:hypothetical protein